MARVRDGQPNDLDNSEIVISGRAFRIDGTLGEGSFGVVWAATCLSGTNEEGVSIQGSTAAIKEILCRSQVDLQRAETERHLLRYVGAQLAAGKSALRCFPSLLISEVDQVEPELWRVRIAMTKLEGQPLEKFLDGLNPMMPGYDASTNPFRGKDALEKICHFVSEMLQQLVPGLEHLSRQAHHRDITPRNILVNACDGQWKFSLVDFGLAVDAGQWKRDLLSSDIGGDGHYWPTSSWFTLCYGAHHLQGYPALQSEYEFCLDLHAMGIAALRTLMELWSREMHRHSVPEGSTWLQHAKLMRLQVAWSRFWDDIVRVWEPVFDAFACGTALSLEQLKSKYAHAGIHHLISSNLCCVRAALFELEYAAAGLPELRQLCSALVVLIRPGMPRNGTPSWRQVRHVLLPKSPPAKDCPPSTSVTKADKPQSLVQSLTLQGNAWHYRLQCA